MGSLAARIFSAPKFTLMAPAASGAADKYGERFHRLWKYYLLSCAGYFRSRQGPLWQIVLSKRTRSGGHRSVR